MNTDNDVTEKLREQLKQKNVTIDILCKTINSGVLCKGDFLTLSDVEKLKSETSSHVVNLSNRIARLENMPKSDEGISVSYSDLTLLVESLNRKSVLVETKINNLANIVEEHNDKIKTMLPGDDGR